MTSLGSIPSSVFIFSISTSKLFLRVSTSSDAVLLALVSCLPANFSWNQDVAKFHNFNADINIILCTNSPAKSSILIAFFQESSLNHLRALPITALNQVKIPASDNKPNVLAPAVSNQNLVIRLSVPSMAACFSSKVKAHLSATCPNFPTGPKRMRLVAYSHAVFSIKFDRPTNFQP